MKINQSSSTLLSSPVYISHFAAWGGGGKNFKNLGNIVRILKKFVILWKFDKISTQKNEFRRKLTFLIF